MIRGAGGKGGGGGGLSVPDDTLRSTAFAKVVDLLCEGPIQGLVNGLKSVYLDGVPIENPDGSRNFENVSFEFRPGTQGQTHIEGFSSVENEVSVNVEVLTTASVTRNIASQELDALRVRVSVPQLFETSEDGKIGPASVQIAIDLQTFGGGFVPVLTDTITGVTNREYERSYRIPLTGTGPWDVRMRRLSPDDSNQIKQRRTFFESYTEIIDAKLRYPNSVLSALRLDSAQFSSIPQRSWLCDLMLIQIPSNYDPIARTYSGVWDGTFSIAWSNNPAWVFYDLVTAERYGLGQHIRPEDVDIWALYTIGRYCDQLVPDGRGGMEPRFTCNLYLQTREEAFTVLNNLVSVFRAMLFWSGGTLTAIHDAPSDPVYLYTAANVTDGVFTYQGASAKQQHTVVLVTWNDPDNHYQQRVEYVEDEALIDRYGIVQTSVVAVGCTSQGQAQRVGRWVLYSESMESETVTWSAGLEGAVGRPGQIVRIADPARAGVRLGGRLLAATSTTVKLDAPVNLLPEQTYTLHVISGGKVQARIVTTAAGNTDALTVAAPFDAIPPVMAVWVLASDAVEPQLVRVLSVAESSPNVFEFTGLLHNPSKYDAIELGTALQVPSTSLLAPPAMPTGVAVAEQLYTLGAVQVSLALLSCQPSRGATQYEFTYRVDNGNPVVETRSIASLELREAGPGLYHVSVVALSSSGRRSAAGIGSGFITGIGGAPAALESLSIAPASPNAVLSWPAVTGITVRTGGAVAIRFTTAAIASASWASATEIERVPGTATSATVALMNGTYLAKTIDANGRESDIARAVAYVAAGGGGGGGGGGALTATARPSSFSISVEGTSRPILTGLCTCEVGGGTGPFTYAWSRTSGTSIDALAPTAAATRFRSFGIGGTEEKLATFICTVTDALGATAVTNGVTVLIRGDSGAYP